LNSPIRVIEREREGGFGGQVPLVGKKLGRGGDEENTTNLPSSSGMWASEATKDEGKRGISRDPRLIKGNSEQKYREKGKKVCEGLALKLFKKK